MDRNETYFELAFLFLFVFLISACAKPSHVMRTAPTDTNFNLGTTNGGSATPSSTLDAFKSTLHPVLTQNCGGCHGVGQVPLHSVNDAQTAMNNIVTSALVDFANPANSRLVAKIRGGHNSFPSSLADQIQSQIVAWIAAANGATGGGGLPVIEPLTATFKSINDRILTPKCLSCHSGTGARDGVRLDSYSRVLARVNLTVPSESELIKICEEGEMPPGPDDLSSEEIAVMRQWVAAGALNN